jgi:hypothetical protein
MLTINFLIYALIVYNVSTSAFFYDCIFLIDLFSSAPYSFVVLLRHEGCKWHNFTHNDCLEHAVPNLGQFLCGMKYLTLFMLQTVLTSKLNT